MLIKDLYKYRVIAQEEGEISTLIEINKQHPVFKGHFPGLPILPGVCQVLMVQEILSGFLNVNLLLRSANNIKFLSFLNPCEKAEINATISYCKSEGDTLKVNAKLYSEGLIYLKLKGEFCERG